MKCIECGASALRKALTFHHYRWWSDEKVVGCVQSSPSDLTLQKGAKELSSEQISLFEDFVKRGFEVLDQLFTNTEPESAFLDYKENCSKDGKLTKQTRKVLAEAISAFANTSGGLLIWGVEAKDHHPMKLAPFSHWKEFRQNLESSTAALVDPPLSGLMHHAFPHPGNSSDGYAVTLIPVGAGQPRMAIGGDQSRYYIRVNASSVAMPHRMLLDAMLSRAQPRLRISSIASVPVTQDPRLISRVAGFDGVFRFLAKIPLRLHNDGDVPATQIGIALDASDIRYSFDPDKAFSPATSYKAVLPLLTDRHRGDAYNLFGFADHLIYPGTAIDIGHINFLFKDWKDSEIFGLPYAIFAQGFSVRDVLEVPGIFFVRPPGI